MFCRRAQRMTGRSQIQSPAEPDAPINSAKALDETELVFSVLSPDFTPLLPEYQVACASQ
jgi:hypothetical protein